MVMKSRLTHIIVMISDTILLITQPLYKTGVVLGSCSWFKNCKIDLVLFLLYLLYKL